MLPKRVLILSRLSASAKHISLQQTRGTKFQSRNPREPHYDRKRMLEICKPIYPRVYKPSWETCTQSTVLPQELPPHPYEKLLADDLKKDWFSSRMICFYHINPVSLEEKKQIRNTFFKKGLNFHVYAPEVVKLALQDSAYASALPLFQSPTALLFCPELKVSEALRISRKTPQIMLLGGIIDDVFLSRVQFQDYSKLPGKDAMHQQLSCLLNAAASNVSRSLTNQTELLSHYLKQHSEEKSNSQKE